VAVKPAGRDSETLIAARNGHSTAPFAPECQSFPDNLRAVFGAKGSANDHTVGDQSRRRADCANQDARAECCCHGAGIAHMARQSTRRARFVATFLEMDLTDGTCRRHRLSPAMAVKPAGWDSVGPTGPEDADSTAPFGRESQSFLRYGMTNGCRRSMM
jgi:hypothetical protein